jgi:hypothetical protein
MVLQLIESGRLHYDAILSGRELDELDEDDFVLATTAGGRKHVYDVKFIFTWFASRNWSHDRWIVPETRELFKYEAVARVIARGVKMGWTSPGRRSPATEIRELELWVGQLSPEQFGAAMQELLNSVKHSSVTGQVMRGSLPGPIAASYMDALVRYCSIRSPSLGELYPELFADPARQNN